MKVKRMLRNVCFYKLFFFAALTSVCQMAHGTVNWRYRSIVTNILDTTHIVIDARRDTDPNSKIEFYGGPVLLDGIAAPEKGSPEEKTLLDVLKRTLLNKKVNVKELLDCGESRGGSVYVTDDPRRRASEDNVNLMLVREGFARFSRRLQSDDGILGGMAEAQRLAQEERKGIWAHYTPETNTVQEATPEPVQPSAAVEKTPSNTVPVTDTQPPPEPKPIPWKLPLLISVIIIGTIGGWRYFRKKEK